MTLSAEQAARIAKEHGLGLPDAHALQRLATDEGEARRLAALFEQPGEDFNPRKLADGLPRL